MKLFFSLYCSCLIVIFLTTFDCRAQTIAEQSDLLEASSRTVLTTLRQIKKLHTDLEYQLDQIDAFHHSAQHQCLTEIIVVLIEMYEQIVSATVTYYVMTNTAYHQNIHATIARIVASGIVKIIGIIGKQVIYFVTHKEMTWKEKIGYCSAIIGIIIMIKLGTDQISVKKEDPLPIIYYPSPSIGHGQIGFVEGKFDNYK